MPSLEFGREGVFHLLELLELRLVPLRLGHQLLGQAPALLSCPAALQLLGTKLGLDLAQVLLQLGGRPCKDKKENTSRPIKE